MSIVFYAAPMSSASPVASVLAELKVPHELVTFNLAAGDQRKPEFLALNPNGKVPTLVVDGTPMFEALAIMLWLGERYGVEQGLWPAASDPARLVAASWCTWAYVTYGTVLVRLQYASNERISKELHSPAQAAVARRDLVQLLDLLEAQLSKQPQLLGTEFSLADLIVASVVGYGVFVGSSVDGHPHVKAWLERFQARPSFGAGLKVESQHAA
jgi:glutathione S-transferase